MYILVWFLLIVATIWAVGWLCSVFIALATVSLRACAVVLGICATVMVFAISPVLGIVLVILGLPAALLGWGAVRGTRSVRAIRARRVGRRNDRIIGKLQDPKWCLKHGYTQQAALLAHKRD